MSEISDIIKFEDSSETISNDEIINFAFLYDDKKHTLKELEDSIITKLKDSNDMTKMRIFYLNHLDLFVKNQNKFQNIIRNKLFLDNYIRYRTVFADITTFLESLNLYSTLSPSTPGSRLSTQPSPRTPQTPSTPSSTLSSPSKSSIKSRFSGLFGKTYPILSIFHQIEPTEFALKCHRMYLAYYFVTEMREYQFYSRVSTREVDRYAQEFSNFYNNLYRKLESEIELFCESNQFSLLADVFIILTKYFLDVGNTPLAQIVISLIGRFQVCKHKKIHQFLDEYNIHLPLSPGALKDYKKFTYLVDPDSINKAFITAQETENKIKTFSFIQKKMITTRDEILAQQLFSVKPNYDDFLIFNYINPRIIIKEKLYTSSTPGGMEYLCIQQKCKQEGSGFDKKTAKYPRKWSKEYCKKTPCKKMGFSQKSSCRYYKNCYK
jgi:hypothetical protein